MVGADSFTLGDQKKSISMLLKGSALSALAAVMAFSALPTAAAAQDGARSDRARFERQAPREARPARPNANGPARAERVMQAPQRVQRVEVQQQRRAAPAPVNTQSRAEPNSGQRGFGLNPNRGRPAERAAVEQSQPNRAWSGTSRPQAERGDRRDRTRSDSTSRGDRNWRDGDRNRPNGGFALDPNRYNDRNRTYRDNRRDDRRADWRDDRRDNRQSYRNGYRDGRHNGYHNGYNDSRRWDRRWRDNRRYDWHGYRSSNRHIYRIGRYYSPYRDYSYRRLSIGFSLDSLFFSNRYWINDPWQYRLPDVYGPYRWVRYYDDVLLVNTYTGEVVDVIHDFFW